MARSEARIRTSIWADDDFRTLPAGAQRMYFVALTEPTLSLCGVTPYSPKRWASFSADTTAKDVSRAVTVLEERRYVVVDPATDELWVRTFIRNDNVLTQPKVVIGMCRALLAVISTMIEEAIWDQLGGGFIDDLIAKFPKMFTEPFPHGLPEPFVKGYAERYAEGYREGYAEGLGIPPRERARDHVRAASCLLPPASSISETLSSDPASIAPTPNDQGKPDRSTNAHEPPPDTDPTEARYQAWLDWKANPRAPWLGPNPPAPDRIVLTHIATTIGWTKPAQLVQLTLAWREGLTELDRRVLEDTLLRCTEARDLAYLRKAIKTAIGNPGPTGLPPAAAILNGDQP